MEKFTVPSWIWLRWTRCESLSTESIKVIKYFDLKLNQLLITIVVLIISEVGKVDILVNNAAVMRTKKRLLTKEGFEMQLGVNHLGKIN